MGGLPPVLLPGGGGGGGQQTRVHLAAGEQSAVSWAGRQHARAQPGSATACGVKETGGHG